jgi:hypothetical protein
VAEGNKLQKLIKIESISKVRDSMLVGALFVKACPDFLTAEAAKKNARKNRRRKPTTRNGAVFFCAFCGYFFCDFCA